MNLHNILYQNVIGSPYFKSLYEIKTYHQVIDEIYERVSSLEPFFKGTHASTAFCLLYKLWTLKLTVKQVQGLITHTDSPHIRAIGFLYLRYVGKPADLWEWYEPYLDDDEELQVEAGPKPRSMTMGHFLRELLTENKWIGTILPRIPVPIARDIEKKLRERPAYHNGTGYEEEPARGGNDREFSGRNGRDHGHSPHSGTRGGRDVRLDDRDREGYREAPHHSSDRRAYSPRRQDRSSRDDRDYRRRSRSPPRYRSHREPDYRGRDDKYANISYDDDDRYCPN
ncbi:putative RNA binding protein [Powellomyces hirtus]|nr:putative RNA binding protein [Powellomyces hirtus]